MLKEVSKINAKYIIKLNFYYVDIQDIERNIHHENQKLTEKTMSQRYSLDYYKREKQKMLEENKTFKRDMMLNLGTAD